MSSEREPLFCVRFVSDENALLDGNTQQSIGPTASTTLPARRWSTITDQTRNTGTGRRNGDRARARIGRRRYGRPKTNSNYNNNNNNNTDRRSSGTKAETTAT